MHAKIKNAVLTCSQRTFDTPDRSSIHAFIQVVLFNSDEKKLHWTLLGGTFFQAVDGVSRANVYKGCGHSEGVYVTPKISIAKP